MLGRIFTVGSYTLLSRLTGFARDIMLAAILGAGPVADAFFVAFRLPNHFRAIFAEGAFNAAFVPAYAHVHGEKGEVSAKLFADRIFTLLFLSQVILLVVAWLFMPQAMSVLAPGFSEDAEQRRLAIELTRITFPYLLLITLVTLYGGMLNVMHRFASAAAASIFLNIAMMATLAVAVWFPTAGSCRRLGRADLRLPAIFPARRRSRHPWRPAALCAAQARRGHPRLLPRAGTRDHRLDGHAGRDVRRHHHRDLPAGGRAVGALLCRPPQPAADRRDRDCGRHRAAAGNGAADHARATMPARWPRNAAPSISRCCCRCRSSRPSSRCPR